jgi:hypothetical protein
MATEEQKPEFLVIEGGQDGYKREVTVDYGIVDRLGSVPKIKDPLYEIGISRRWRSTFVRVDVVDVVGAAMPLEEEVSTDSESARILDNHAELLEDIRGILLRTGVKSLTDEQVQEIEARHPYDFSCLEKYVA